MKNKRVFRSLLSVLLALTMLAQLVPMSIFAQNSVLYGDVDSNDTIDNTDVDLLARYLSNHTSAEIDEDAADVDRNGVIDLNDLLYLVKLVKGADISLGQTATVTFDTNGGTAIDPITVVVGSTITAPEAQKDNAVFLGWYTDEALTTPFYSSDPIVQDVTVYAKYAQLSGEPEYTPAAFALQDQPTDLVFNIQRVSGELAPQSYSL